MSGSAPRGTSKYEALLNQAIDRRQADLHTLSDCAFLQNLGLEEVMKEEAHRRLEDILPSDQRHMTFERRDSRRANLAARTGCMLQDVPSSETSRRGSIDNGATTTWMQQQQQSMMAGGGSSRRSLDSVTARRRSSVVFASSLTTALEDGESFLAALSTQVSDAAPPKVPRVLPTLTLAPTSGGTCTSPTASSPSSPRCSRGQVFPGNLAPPDRPRAPAVSRSASFSSRRGSIAGLPGLGPSSCGNPNKALVEALAAGSASVDSFSSSKSLVLDGRGSPMVFSPQGAAKAAGRLFATPAASRSADKPFGGVGNAAQCAAARALEAKQRRKSKDLSFSQDDIMSRLSKWGDGKRLGDD